MTREKDKYAVVDIGGDDRGAYALGRYRKDILEENNYDMFLIINKYIRKKGGIDPCRIRS